MKETEEEAKIDLSNKNNDELAVIRTELADLRTRMAQERTEFAFERTVSSYQRTVQANERSLSAWIRSGLAAAGGGLAVAEFIRGDVESLLAKIIGGILIILGAGMCLLALDRYHRVHRQLKQINAPVPPLWPADLMVGGLLSVIVLIFLMLFT